MRYSEREIFKGRHSFVCGMTQHGKTYFTIKRMQDSKQGVFFFNVQHEESGLAGFIKADINTTPSILIKALKDGRKVNYLPTAKGSGADERTAQEFVILVDLLFGEFSKVKPIVFAVDEVHVLAHYKEAKVALIRVANRGLRWGMNAVFISQRPADVPYTIYTQCDRHYLFFTGMEREYFRRKGIDYLDLQAKIAEAGGYSYCVFDNVSLKGGFKE